jgi:hypothetical protein
MNTFNESLKHYQTMAIDEIALSVLVSNNNYSKLD